MDNKNYDIYFDCGSSKIRAGVFSKEESKNVIYYESNFFFDHVNIFSEIQKIITTLEKDTNEYLNTASLMVDSSNKISIGISISKKFDGSKVKKEDIQFLKKKKKKQILKNYFDHSIVHTIINNYKVDGIDHVSFPENKECHLVSLDIIFICLPKETIEYFKKIFVKLDISINNIFCTSYTRSINYKDNFPLINDLSFIDIGFNKTSINCFKNNKIIFLDSLPIGGNHITKDISKILKVSLEKAENFKLSFYKDQKLLNENKISANLIQEIIFSRIEEILELSSISIKLNSNIKDLDKYKIILMGEGSKILDNKFKEKISFSNEIDLLDEAVEDILNSAFKLFKNQNKQEIIQIAKKPTKQGFFEKLFHFFR